MVAEPSAPVYANTFAPQISFTVEFARGIQFGLVVLTRERLRKYRLRLRAPWCFSPSLWLHDPRYLLIWQRKSMGAREHFAAVFSNRNA